MELEIKSKQTEDIKVSEITNLKRAISTMKCVYKDNFHETFQEDIVFWKILVDIIPITVLVHGRWPPYFCLLSYYVGGGGSRGNVEGICRECVMGLVVRDVN